VAVAVAAAAGLVLAGTSAASADGPAGGSAGLTPQFTVISSPDEGPAAASNGPTIPTWTGGFTYGGNAFSYQMVGTDPAAGSATTTVATRLIPLRFVMSDGTVLDTAPVETRFLASPLFNPAPFTSGTGQFADELQRAEFWNDVSTTSPNYHVELGSPTVEPEVTVQVPAADGSAQQVNGVTLAIVNVTWFYNQLKTIAGPGHVPGTVLPIVLSNNVVFYQGSVSNCCIIGFHGAFGTSHTYAFASWLTGGVFSGGFADITPMSHELGEWMNDPFGANHVPGWVQPSVGTCNHLLEVGDPIEAKPHPTFSVHLGGFTYHPQDLAGVSWFSHASPSSEQNGLYSYHGTLTTPATHC
jgi:hypothetical protein